ncbi:MAG TPA: Ni/Fe hydrogenase subunit alpha [Candidatus Cybelea sp.]|nr:Ni/Fe hydrogenase subunit alpha [Candidatus Cybelea sp.]
MTDKTIKVEVLARVEGEGALDLTIRNGKVETVQLRIFEPPRLFEGLLRGRDFSEAPDITARICGICPVAYQMSSVHAMEAALGVKIDGAVRLLRRLLYCGEWIESHGLHVVMLHAPDFLGYPDAIRMAEKHGAMVEAGLALKKAGNDLMRVLGGREIHPINVKVGGFYRAPSKAELRPIAEQLKKARDLAVSVLRWTAGFEIPDYERDYEFVSLRHPDEYPFNEGHIVSTRGIDVAAAEYESEFEERHVAHSTALHSVTKRHGTNYLVGPIARYNINFDRLPADVQGLAKEAGLQATCRNPFKSILIRGVEIVYACDESLRLIAEYQPPAAPAVKLEPRAGIGHAATEAPRGTIWHRYRLAADGAIQEARIVPPTSQNQGSIEEDLRAVATAAIDLPEDALRDRCEQAIRNYDPCISCSTHFVKLKVHRG